MKRILSLGILLILAFGLVSMSGCEKKKLSEMEWEQCKRHLTRCGMEFPEEFEDFDVRGFVVEIEQNDGVLMSYEPWDNCWDDLKKAMEKYYGKPMPLKPLESSDSTE